MRDPADRAADLLAAHKRGDRKAFERLVPLVYADLRRLAHASLERARPGSTLNTTALVHEAYLRLASHRNAGWEGRGHLMAVAAQAMRQIIIDSLRRRRAVKRGGGISAIQLDERHVALLDREETLLDLDEALTRLEAVDPRLSRVVECRFFAGLTEEETAEAMGTSVRTVQRTWSRAKGWLRKELGGIRIESGS